MENIHYLERRRRWSLVLTALLILLALTALTSLIQGSSGPMGTNNSPSIPPEAVFDILTGKSWRWPNTFKTIVLDIRLPRVLLAALVGCSLAVSGTVMQGIFRNPMADPYIIGLSSGAALGAASSILLSAGFYPLPLMAFLGGTLTIFLVYFLSRSGGGVRVETMLLSGIAVSSFLSAIISLLMYLTAQYTHLLVFWLLGSLSMASWKVISIAFPIIALGSLCIQFFARDLNAMLLGEEHAISLGINVEVVKKTLLILSSLVTGTAVAFSGTIGFVGLIIPHLMRLLLGPNHSLLLPASTLMGGIFLILADMVARTLIYPSSLPVGVVTALCGAPFFLYLLHRRRRGLV
jgi:iron complex transport system permease protein